MKFKIFETPDKEFYAKRKWLCFWFKVGDWHYCSRGGPVHFELNIRHEKSVLCLIKYLREKYDLKYPDNLVRELTLQTN